MKLETKIHPWFPIQVGGQCEPPFASGDAQANCSLLCNSEKKQGVTSGGWWKPEEKCMLRQPWAHCHSAKSIDGSYVQIKSMSCGNRTQPASRTNINKSLSPLQWFAYWVWENAQCPLLASHLGGKGNVTMFSSHSDNKLRHSGKFSVEHQVQARGIQNVSIGPLENWWYGLLALATSSSGQHFITSCVLSYLLSTVLMLSYGFSFNSNTNN